MAPRVPSNRAYVDVITALLQARTDPVTERFDEELTAAVAAGDVPSALARRLRHWQRASLDALVEHARLTLPPALAAVAAAAESAHAASRGAELASYDAGYDARHDAGRDAGRDAVRDAVRDAGYDARHDAGRDESGARSTLRAAEPPDDASQGEPARRPEPFVPPRRAEEPAERLLVAGLRPYQPAASA